LQRADAAGGTGFDWGILVDARLLVDASSPRASIERRMSTKTTKKAAEEPMSADHPIDPKLVRELAALLSESDLSEIEVEKGDLRIRISRMMVAPAPVSYAVAAPQAAPAPLSAPMPAPAAAPGLARAESTIGVGAVPSPMVGTAYLRPSPDAKAFVEIGQTVKAGDKLLLIEAMKTFNEVVAPRAGIISGILVEDGQPVEYGEALMVIE
jgi:acetyl-CoA carboxylase biotin carboxyl carrier protein